MASSWPFCPQCGTIMDPPERDIVNCTHCPYSCSYEAMNIKEIVTKSASVPKPAWIKDEAAIKVSDKHATIDEPCPKCSHHQLYFYTMQLRSVDEGSTVFYECPSCSHTFSQNN